MLDPNPYAEDYKKQKTVQIRILDVLFADQDCTLIYMHDLTKFVAKQRHDLAHQHLLMANSHVRDEIQAPQKSISILSKNLMKDCNQSQL